MKIIQQSNEYSVFGDEIIIHNNLPATFYNINFNPHTGYFLIPTDPFEINEKIYGIHNEKIKKVLNTFNIFTRNLGIILSGDKGIGKSLFAKELTLKCVENNLPVILVKENTPGLSDFIMSISQEVVVLFDEFDKVFSYRDNSKNIDTQNNLLSLFDGLSIGKKLFIITCNNIDNLNEFLINRPGRFHYHFRFDYPNQEEITTYLQDKLDKQYWDEIESVLHFAKNVNLNYDCLRSIAFELQSGITFKDAIGDLNILNTEDEYYKISVVFNNGNIVEQNSECNMYSDELITLSIYTPKNSCQIGNITFNPEDVVFNSNGQIIPGEQVKFDPTVYPDNYYDESISNEINSCVKSGINYIKIKRIYNKKYKQSRFF